MARAAPRNAEEKIAPLLERIALAFEGGQAQEALQLTEEALALAPRSAAALHYKAEAHVALGQTQEAAAAFERALAEGPDDPELLLGMADFLIGHNGEDRESVERGLALAARARKVAGRRADPELLYELALVEGIGLNQLGETERALARLDEALERVPNSQEALFERAVALFELCRFEGAEKELTKLLEKTPDDAWAHHYLGLLAERRKDGREARRYFGRARALAPEEFFPPVELSDADFDAAVEDAIKRMPEEVKLYLENATIAVESIPSDEDLTASKPPLSPGILGVFRGTPVGERSASQGRDLPPSIVLYQKNLERFARTREELIEQIGITVMHEVGHLLGLDEEDLWERGLE